MHDLKLCHVIIPPDSNNSTLVAPHGNAPQRRSPLGDAGHTS
jgi:hypothetical protein